MKVGVALALTLALACGTASADAASALPVKGPAAAGSASSLLPQALEGVSIEQKLGAVVPLDLAFRDETGRDVTLREAIGGKPAVLNLAYYECPMLCTLVWNGLLASLRALPFDVGNEFRIVTLSIDPRETAQLAAAKKENVVAEYGRAGAGPGWSFLTGDEPAIKALADAVGFRYRYDERNDVYAHAAGILVLTPDGRVARYFYGIDVAPRDLRLALVEASDGKIGGLADQVMLFCYQYDPKAARYTTAALNLVRGGAIVTVACIAAFIFLTRRRESSRASRAA
jgi:protein SCO1/2